MRLSRRPFPWTLAALGVLAAAAPGAQAARSWDASQPLSAPGASAWIGKPLTAAAFTPTGDATVAWIEEAGGSYSIAARRTPKFGDGSPAQTLGGGYNPPTVSALGVGGSIVAWVGSTVPGEIDGRVLVARSAADGRFEAAEEVARTGSFYNQPGAAVAGNLLGQAVVVYADPQNAIWRVRRAVDGTWSAPSRVVAPSSDIVWRLSAVMSETGEAAYAWYAWDPAVGTRAGVATETPDGELGRARILNAPDGEGGAPSLAMDATGNAVVTWPELRDGNFAGPINVAVKPPLLPFGPGQVLDGSAGDHAGAPVSLSASGVAVIAYAEMNAVTPTSGYGGGLRAFVGHVPTGAFGKSEAVSRHLVSDPVTVATDPLGNALFFFEDWDTYEPRVVRRTITGRYGQERNAVPCPIPGFWPIAANVDALGDASLLWADGSFLRAESLLRLSRDRASLGFSPDPCPPPKPWLTWTEDPQPGQPVTFDAVGADDPDATRVRFEWDLDGDGTFELDTDRDRHATRTFPNAGVHPVGLRVTLYSQRPGNSTTWTCRYEIRVGLPPLPTESSDDPEGWDPAPPALPDESPWPAGPGPQPTEVPTVPLPDLPLPDLPLPGVPLPGGVATAAGGLRPRPATVTPSTLRAEPGLTLALVAATRVRRTELERRGLPVTVRSATSGRVRLRLRTADRRTTLADRLVTTRAGVPVTVRLRPAKARRAALRRAARRGLVLEARSAGRTTSTRVGVR